MCPFINFLFSFADILICLIFIYYSLLYITNSAYALQALCSVHYNNSICCSEKKKNIDTNVLLKVFPRNDTS